MRPREVELSRVEMSTYKTLCGKGRGGFVGFLGKWLRIRWGR